MRLLFTMMITSGFLFLVNETQGQVNQDQFVNYQTMNNVNVGNTVHLSTPFRGGTEGSKYIFDEWKQARCVFFRNNLKFKTERLNYNIVDGLFEVEVDDQIRGINAEYVLTFEVDNNSGSRVFTSCRAPEFKSLSLSGFMETLYTGDDYTLYEHAYVYIRPATYNTALMEGATKEKIYIKGDYYVTTGDGEVLKLDNKKDLKEIVSDKKKLKGVKIKRDELVGFFQENEL